MSDDIDIEVVEKILFEFVRNNTTTVQHLLRDNDKTKSLANILERLKARDEWEKLDDKNKQLTSYLLQIMEFDKEYLNTLKFMERLK